MPTTTTVHLLRHGEVHNPEGVLYGRRDGFHLSALGHQMAERVAESVKDRDIVHLRTSPLERAQETARPDRHRARSGAGDRRAADRVRETSSRASSSASGPGRARCASRRRGSTSTTPGSRPGASPTSTSWPG